MNCSSFEPKLVQLVEGELPPRERAAVLQHVGQCPGCNRLLENVRVVDGLLIQAPEVAPPADFTAAAMAGIRGMPVPRSRRPRWWMYVLIYLAAAWLGILGLGIFAGPAIAGTLAMGAGWLAAAAGGLARVAEAAAGGLGHNVLTAVTMAVLVLDALLALAIASAYIIIRPRIAAHLSRSTESSR